MTSASLCAISLSIPDFDYSGNQAMQLSALTALSPVDGRYGAKAAAPDQPGDLVFAAEVTADEGILL